MGLSKYTVTALILERGHKVRKRSEFIVFAESEIDAASLFSTFADQALDAYTVLAVHSNTDPEFLDRQEYA